MTCCLCASHQVYREILQVGSGFTGEFFAPCLSCQDKRWWAEALRIYEQAIETADKDYAYMMKSAVGDSEAETLLADWAGIIAEEAYRKADKDYRSVSFATTP